MTNKEKLETINKALDVCYGTITIIEKVTYFKDITQAIYNLESTKLLLEPIENNHEFKPINMQ
jgi:hypothetical protein